MVISTLLRTRYLVKGTTKYYSLIVANAPLAARRELSTLLTASSFNDAQIILPVKNIRVLSSTSTPTPSKKEDKEDDSETNKSLNSMSVQSFRKDILSKILTPKNQFYALVGGGTLGAYLISKGLLAFTSFFTHLNPAFIAKYGFYTGFGAATLLGGMACVTADNLYLRADPTYHYCYKWVRNDPKVQMALGDGIQAGKLTSYRIDAGRFRIHENKPVWTPPRIQMVFDIEGTGPPYRTGLVTCEAIKPPGFPAQVQTTLLMVDYETGNEAEGGNNEEDQTMFLVGSEEDLKHVSRRSGLSLEQLARQVHINKAAKECKSVE